MREVDTLQWEHCGGRRKRYEPVTLTTHAMLLLMVACAQHCISWGCASVLACMCIRCVRSRKFAGTVELFLVCRLGSSL